MAPGRAAPDARQLGAVSSAPMTDLVEHLLRSSDNVLAEVLAREVALARGGRAVVRRRRRAGAGRARAGRPGPLRRGVHDGSGLSTQDRVPARLLGAVLAAAAAPAAGPRASEQLRPLVSGLPVAGGDGTLDDRFGPDGPAAAGRGVVRAKTGTLTGVSSLAGVVTDADGRLLVFALMSNGPSPAGAAPAGRDGRGAGPLRLPVTSGAGVGAPAVRPDDA